MIEQGGQERQKEMQKAARGVPKNSAQCGRQKVVKLLLHVNVRFSLERAAALRGHLSDRREQVVACPEVLTSKT